MFAVSKLVGWLLHPVSIAIFMAVAGVLFQVVSRKRLALAFSILSIVWLAAVAYSPLGAMLIRPLEDRFTKVEIPENIAGIIILGGGIESEISRSRGIVEIANSADRMLEGARLANSMRNAPVIYTGGSGLTIANAEASAPIAKSLLISIGVDEERITIEDRSRNTFEHALRLKPIIDMTNPAPYVLITSAFHMPRAIGVFEEQGWNVIAYPVDFRTAITGNIGDPSRSSIDNFSNMTIAMKEWVGLFSYWILGRTNAFFPQQ